MTSSINIHLTLQQPESHWGNSDISFHSDSAKIHLNGQDNLRQIQMAARKIRSQGINAVSLQGDSWDINNQWAFYQGFATAKSGFTVEWYGDDKIQKSLEHRRESASFARQLVNATPEELSPVALAEAAAEWLQSLAPNKITSTIIKGEALLEHQWVGIHGVGRGSERPPALLELDFNPSGKSDTPVEVALVGKGITFDSGGYSIKSSEGMLGMKADMGGAATVTGALGLAIKNGLNKRIKLFLCCAENLISGHAYKLGDVLTYKNGTTVEVVNTDAEGRLVLADGLQAASETGAPLIINAATLTGAAYNAVGTNYNAIFSPQTEMLDLAREKATAVAERVWPLPMDPWHKDMCPSPYADTANSRPVKGGGAGGASNAAAFLWRFVRDDAKWLHFDLAGAFSDNNSPLWAAGGTAHGVLTIAELIK
ncbi:aminopeptidase PepB [Parashewanella curva]|uniref:Aminopeptidase PepB n=2 Tax=Parashewanella curva TaxID=2338552 RepID=A0A3L8PYR5_9GAMM|nr:aminopeptidase PepB [Parashewanella curva]RLV59222.1 aminopeptidase PepB [Parashewanella curva]